MTLRKFIVTGFLCSSLMVVYPCEAAKGQKDESTGALKARISRLENENQMLGKALAEATKRHHEALSDAKVAGRQQDEADEQSCPVGADMSVLYNKMEEMKTQNQSLRDTIRAQNDALLAADNSSQLIQDLRQENAALKGQGGRVNGRESESQESAKIDGLKETIKALRQDNERLLSQNGGNTSDTDDEKIAQIQLENQELKARIALLDEAGQGSSKSKAVAKKGKKVIQNDATLDIATIELLQAQAAQKNVAIMRGEKQVTGQKDFEELETPSKKISEVTKSSKNKQGSYALKAKKKDGVQKQRVPEGIHVAKGDALPDISPAVGGQSSEDLLALDPMPLPKKK